MLNAHIDGLVQDCSNSSALTMELLQSGTKPSTFACRPPLRPALAQHHDIFIRLHSCAITWHRITVTRHHNCYEETHHINLLYNRNANHAQPAFWELWNELRQLELKHERGHFLPGHSLFDLVTCQRNAGAPCHKWVMSSWSEIL